MFEKITPDNVMMYAMKHYNNPQGDNEKEFLDDMKRFKYIKRLLRKYQDNGFERTIDFKSYNRFK